MHFAQALSNFPIPAAAIATATTTHLNLILYFTHTTHTISGFSLRIEMYAFSISPLEMPYKRSILSLNTFILQINMSIANWWGCIPFHRTGSQNGVCCACAQHRIVCVRPCMHLQFEFKFIFCADIFCFFVDLCSLYVWFLSFRTKAVCCRRWLCSRHFPFPPSS